MQPIASIAVPYLCPTSSGSGEDDHEAYGGVSCVLPGQGRFLGRTCRAVDGFDNAHGLVFTSRAGHPVNQRNVSGAGRPVDQRNVSCVFHRARTAAGVDHGGFKTFRAMVATQLAEAGLHPRKTQVFLGHAHVTTTMTYYTGVTDVDEAADLLPGLRRRVRGGSIWNATPRMASAGAGSLVELGDGLLG